MKRGLLGFVGLMLFSMAAATMAQAPVYQPVGTVRQVMLDIVAPTSDVIFKVPEPGAQRRQGMEDGARQRAHAGRDR